MQREVASLVGGAWEGSLLSGHREAGCWCYLCSGSRDSELMVFLGRREVAEGLDLAIYQA